MLLLHGLGGTSNTFQTLMGALAGHRAIRPDLPGSGRSPWPAEPLSIEALAEAVAARSPDGRGARPRRRALDGDAGRPAPRRDAARPGGEPHALRRADRARRGGAARACARARGGAGAGHGAASPTRSSPPRWPPARARTRPPPWPSCANRSCASRPRATRGPARRWPGRPATDPRRIAAPTLLVTGDADPVAPAGMARSLADGIAGAYAPVLDRCGHWVTVEAAEGEAARAAGGLIGRGLSGA